MHPPRPPRLAEFTRLADDLAEWLLARCPLSTLTILSLLVIGSTIVVTQPFSLMLIAALGDTAINLMKRIRRKRREGGSAGVPTHAPA